MVAFIIISKGDCRRSLDQFLLNIESHHALLRNRKASNFLRLQFLVENINTETFANTVQVSNILGQFVDGLHLFIQKLLFQIVG